MYLGFSAFFISTSSVPLCLNSTGTVQGCGPLCLNYSSVPLCLQQFCASTQLVLCRPLCLNYSSVPLCLQQFCASTQLVLCRPLCLNYSSVPLRLKQFCVGLCASTSDNLFNFTIVSSVPLCLKQFCASVSQLVLCRPLCLNQRRFCASVSQEVLCLWAQLFSLPLYLNLSFCSMSQLALLYCFSLFVLGQRPLLGGGEGGGIPRGQSINQSIMIPV